MVIGKTQACVGLLGTYKLWLNKLALEIVDPLKSEFYNDVSVNKFLEGTQVGELVYPTQADDATLSRTPPTEFEGLVATFATVGYALETRRVQSVHRLEICQITLAKSKMLNSEEEKFIDIDELGVLKVKQPDAKLAPCLITLEENIKSCTSFIGALPEDDLKSAEFTKYDFLKMISLLGDLLSQERNKARANYICVDASESLLLQRAGWKSITKGDRSLAKRPGLHLRQVQQSSARSLAAAVHRSQPGRLHQRQDRISKFG